VQARAPRDGVRARRSRTGRARFFRAAALLLPLLAGCVNERQERELGDQIAAQVNLQLPLVRDPVLHRYVNQLGGVIARESGRPGVDYRFYIVNSDQVNAFALPGGHVYVNRGLVERTENVSELSAVLAHEIGHVAARHGAEMMERRLRTGSVVGILYNLILGAEPEILDQRALHMGRALWSASHSREAELEADELAVEYMIRAGVDPQGMITLLNGLLREEMQTGRTHLAWFSTHPMTQDRIEVAKREIVDEAEDARRKPRALARDIPSYAAFLRRVRALPRPLTAHPGPMQ
jgi:predicted Zn-dependent protease